MLTKQCGELSLTVTNPYPVWIRIADGNGNEICLKHTEIRDLEHLVAIAKREATRFLRRNSNEI